jgi:hypothetical protein
MMLTIRILENFLSMLLDELPPVCHHAASMRKAGYSHHFARPTFLCGCALVLLMSSLALGCQGAIHQPPTFADFQQAYRQGAETEAGVNAMLELFRAAMPSDRELHKILTGTNVRAMIGAGIQGPIANPINLELLERATVISPTNPVVWAALAYHSFALLANHGGDSAALEAKFKQAVETMRTLDPGNSVPLYLDAAVACLATNVAEAESRLVKASRVEGFDTYENELTICAIQALEAAGRSKFTARIVASGSAPTLTAWGKLYKTVLATDPSDEEVRACLVFGERIARGRSLLNQILGGSIQVKAMDKLGGPEFADQKKQIADRKELIKRAARYQESVEKLNVTEAQWVQFYDRSFESGEMEAIQWLAETRGETF